MDKPERFQPELLFFLIELGKITVGQMEKVADNFDFYAQKIRTNCYPYRA